MMESKIIIIKKNNFSKFFDNFLFVIFYWDQNIGQIRNRPFSSCVVHLKGFSPI
jgi:hypothetical protein